MQHVAVIMISYMLPNLLLQLFFLFLRLKLLKNKRKIFYE